MGVSAPPHTTCAVFNDVPADLPADGIHRFIVGQDPVPRLLTDDEARVTLGDPFAELVLLEGRFPHTAGDTLAELKRAAGEGASLARHRFFLLGEGGQIAPAPGGPRVRRGMRFLVACGSGETGPDVLVSAFRPDEGNVELMSWDEKAGGFNFYRTVGENGTWVFAGNSRDALTDPTQGNGPFESHRSGNFLMKELKFPWVNWDSQVARIEPSIFAMGDPLREHEWFKKKEEKGAQTCEEEVAVPSIERWTKARFDAMSRAGTVPDARRVMRQVVTSPAVNLVSSRTKSAAPGDQPIDLAPTFFVDVDGLIAIIGNEAAPPPFVVAKATYLAALTKFNVRLTDRREFARPGDTHFAFVVPERAFEDQRVVFESIRVGLLTERLAACLLMTDFPNPVFSSRRASLLEHSPATADLTDGSDFSLAMSKSILAAAASATAQPGEREFAERWAAGEGWRATFARLLNDYYTDLVQRLATQDGFDDVYRLAEWRRALVREMPIFENPLLFSESDIVPTPLEMRADGAVVVGPPVP